MGQKQIRVKRIKPFGVTKTGRIATRFDMRVNDGYRWCVDYNGMETGELVHHDHVVEQFDQLSAAVACSREIRINAATRDFDNYIQQISTGPYIVDFKMIHPEDKK